MISLFLLFLLLVLELVEPIGLFDPGGCLALASFHEFPPFPALPISLQNGLLSLALLLDLGEVPAQVVEFISSAFEFLLCISFGSGECEHFLVVGVDEVDQLSLVGHFLVLALELQFLVLVPEFLELALFSVDFSLEFVLASAVILDESIVQLFVLLADLLNLLLLVVTHLPYLALQLIDLLLLLLSVLGPLLPQSQ